jgi:hypothetical protein
MGLCGLICLIAATVLFLHTWLEWWQAFGATGLTVVLIVFIGARVSRHPTA